LRRGVAAKSCDLRPLSNLPNLADDACQPAFGGRAGRQYYDCCDGGPPASQVEPAGAPRSAEIARAAPGGRAKGRCCECRDPSPPAGQAELRAFSVRVAGATDRSAIPDQWALGDLPHADHHERSPRDNKQDWQEMPWKQKMHDGGCPAVALAYHGLMAVGSRDFLEFLDRENPVAEQYSD
jgi:hypothetical protein